MLQETVGCGDHLAAVPGGTEPHHLACSKRIPHLEQHEQHVIRDEHRSSSKACARVSMILGMLGHTAQGSMNCLALLRWIQGLAKTHQTRPCLYAGLDPNEDIGQPLATEQATRHALQEHWAGCVQGTAKGGARAP